MIEILNQIKIPTLIITTLCKHNRLVVGEVIFCEFCKEDLITIDRLNKKSYFFPQDALRYERDQVRWFLNSEWIEWIPFKAKRGSVREIIEELY